MAKEHYCGNREVEVGMFSVGRGPLGVFLGEQAVWETTEAAVVSHLNHSDGPISGSPSLPWLAD